MISLYRRREVEALGALISVQLAKEMLGIMLVGMFHLRATSGPGPEHPGLPRCHFHPSNVLLELQKCPGVQSILGALE